MEDTNNSIKISGRISSEFTFSHEFYGECFWRFNVVVGRLSSQSDILPITVSERIIKKEKTQHGQAVHIIGQIRSYNNYVEADKKNKLVITIFAREISLLTSAPAQDTNDVFLDGYLCKPVIYRTTPFGREITDLIVAVNRSYNKSDYIPCIAWGRSARFAGNLNVGDHIRLWGRKQSRQYQKKLDDSTIFEKTAYEVSISKIEQVMGSYFQSKNTNWRKSQ